MKPEEYARLLKKAEADRQHQEHVQQSAQRFAAHVLGRAHDPFQADVLGAFARAAEQQQPPETIANTALKN